MTRKAHKPGITLSPLTLERLNKLPIVEDVSSSHRDGHEVGPYVEDVILTSEGRPSGPVRWSYSNKSGYAIRDFTLNRDFPFIEITVFWQYESLSWLSQNTASLLYVVRGELAILVKDEQKEAILNLGSGQTWYIPPGCLYRLMAPKQDVTCLIFGYPTTPVKGFLSVYPKDL